MVIERPSGAKKTAAFERMKTREDVPRRPPLARRDGWDSAVTSVVVSLPAKMAANSPRAPAGAQASSSGLDDLGLDGGEFLQQVPNRSREVQDVALRQAAHIAAGIRDHAPIALRPPLRDHGP